MFGYITFKLDYYSHIRTKIVMYDLLNKYSHLFIIESWMGWTHKINSKYYLLCEKSLKGLFFYKMITIVSVFIMFINITDFSLYFIYIFIFLLYNELKCISKGDKYEKDICIFNNFTYWIRFSCM